MIVMRETRFFWSFPMRQNSVKFFHAIKFVWVFFAILVFFSSNYGSFVFASQSHDKVRLFIIKLQASQAGYGRAVLLGDSITEGLYYNTVCGSPIINAGIGGIGVRGMLDFLPAILQATRPSVVVVLLGVNDAYGKSVPLSSLSRWSVGYDHLVNAIISFGATPVLMTILPVEKGKPLGAQSFDEQAIKYFNQQIRKIAKAHKIPLVDTYKMWANSGGYILRGSTVDGVHLTGKAYKRLYDEFKEAVSKGFAKRDRPCGAGGRTLLSRSRLKFR